LSSLRGIGAFWCALLNLSLNSVPLLKPAQGIALMHSAAVQLHAQVADAVSRVAP